MGADMLAVPCTLDFLIKVVLLSVFHSYENP